LLKHEKHTITASPENDFITLRISFGKLCAATYTSAHATLLSRVLHIIVKNYSARSIHEFIFSDLSELTLIFLNTLQRYKLRIPCNNYFINRNFASFYHTSYLSKNIIQIFLIYSYFWRNNISH